MKFDVKHRFTGAIQFTAEIDCEEDASISVKLGLAVKWAINAGANLAGANLARANLARANLAGANLARANLARANLAGADLAGANLAGADLAGANLAGADLAGADLAGADLARADLAGANLAVADLAGAYLAGADLAGAYLAGANLAGAYLAGANLARADLARANLGGADLARANLGGAYLAEQLSIAPEDIPIIPNIDAAILAAIQAGGTLDMRSWHSSCGTTHCRAGWAIHLAGEKGKALEDRVGPQMAGTLIYQASRPGKPAPWFFGPDEKAMADISKCAAESPAGGERE
jgi:uncharacterized protein YjbI with pentapeptide repeats